MARPWSVPPPAFSMTWRPNSLWIITDHVLGTGRCRASRSKKWARPAFSSVRRSQWYQAWLPWVSKAPTVAT